MEKVEIKVESARKIKKYLEGILNVDEEYIIKNIAKTEEEKKYREYVLKDIEILKELSSELGSWKELGI